MIGEVAGDATLDDLRTLFTRSVTGRGPLAAIRVGNQPYGIVLAGPAPRAEREPQQTISLDAAIERIIARARPFWVNCLPQLAQFPIWLGLYRMLTVTIADDGAGVDPERIRRLRPPEPEDDGQEGAQIRQ